VTPKQEDLSQLEKLEAIPEPEPTPTIQKVETPARVAKKDLTAIQKQVQGIAKEHGWGEGEQWEALSWIIHKESSWNPTAQNKTSTAYGLFQWLDATRQNYNCPKTADVEIQTRCGIKYIQARYGTPTEAQKFHERKGWY
jgi:membrane-bound lytic murein transglycosylase MltF